MSSPEGGYRPGKKEIKAQRREERKQQEVAKISRRTFLRRVVAGAAGGILTAAGIATVRNRESTATRPEVPRPTATTVEGRIGELTLLSERLRAPYEALKHHMEQFKNVLASAEIDDAEARLLREPIDLFLINDKNPLKDYYQLLITDLRQRGAESFKTAFEVNSARPEYFTLSLNYSTDASTQRNIASYAPAFRDIRIREHFTSESVFDGLVGYHELVHAVQDTQIRKDIHTQTDFDLYISESKATFQGKPIFNGRMEHDAYLRSIRLFNLVTQKQFERDCQSGTVDIAAYVARFGGAEEEDQKQFAILLELGATLYQPNVPSAVAKHQVEEAITNEYRKHGSIMDWSSIDELRDVIKNQPRD